MGLRYQPQPGGTCFPRKSKLINALLRGMEGGERGQPDRYNFSLSFAMKGENLKTENLRCRLARKKDLKHPREPQDGLEPILNKVEIFG